MTALRDQDADQSRRQADGEQLAPPATAHSQPRRQYARMATYSCRMPRTCSSVAPRACS